MILSYESYYSYPNAYQNDWYVQSYIGDSVAQVIARITVVVDVVSPWVQECDAASPWIRAVEPRTPWVQEVETSGV